MCRGRGWATADALGVGGLLVDAWLLSHLDPVVPGGVEDLLASVLSDAARSLALVAGSGQLEAPPSRRLPFRELGLGLGLAAVRRITDPARPGVLSRESRTASSLRALSRHLPIREAVEDFWLDPRHRESPTWTEHEDINAVMLAASLAPEGYLGRRSS
jgi:hypothetical protein